MRKSIGIAVLVVGTTIGAGFATGRELVSMFGFYGYLSPFVALICALLIFLFVFLLLLVGKKLKGKNANRAIFGRLGWIADVVMVFNSLVSLAVMFAGIDSLFGVFYNIKPIYSLVAGAIGVLIVSAGVKGLIGSNVVLLPLVILTPAVASAISIISFSALPPLPEDFFASLIYISLNIYLVSSLLTSFEDTSVKQAIGAATISALVIGGLLLMLILAINSNPSVAQSELPVLTLAGKHPAVYVFVVLTITAGIFTTMLTALANLTDYIASIVGNRLVAGTIAVALATLIASIGFEAVVATFYPLLGAFGLLYILASLTVFFREPSDASSADAQPAQQGSTLPPPARKAQTSMP